MKRLLLTIILVSASIFAIGQKYAYVDTEYILNNIPAYKAAQEKLNQLSTEWQAEVEAEYDKIQQMFRKFQNEEVLLTEEMKRQRKEELITRERQVKELQRKYFGPEGDLNKRRIELVQPIQDEVFKIIEQIAEEENLAVIFDTAAGANMLYTDPKYDKSDTVLEKLGYKN